MCSLLRRQKTRKGIYPTRKEIYHPFPTHLNTVKEVFKLKALVGKALVTPLNYALYVAVYAAYALG